MENNVSTDVRGFRYFTTPIYYANGTPHAGHVYTTLLAQILKIHYISRNYNVKLLTGLDEHGETVEHHARELQITPQTLVDRMAQVWKSSFKKLGIEYDIFMRTTDTAHKKNVQEILNYCYQKGDIYFGTHEGHYCIKCESFLNSSERDKQEFCLIHKKRTELRKETNYFFKVSKYKHQLHNLIKSGALISQERYQNELLGMLDAFDGDLSISRPKERLSWGIELPFDNNHITYVWFDALPNYLTGIGGLTAAKTSDYWRNVIHLLGKDILKFHGIFWPAMCFSLDLTPPKLLIHGWLLKDGHKMSKSLGNVITFEQVCEHGVEMFVNTIFRSNLGEDIDLTWKMIFERYNADLANGVGNLFSRSLTLCKKYLNFQLPQFYSEFATQEQNEIESEVLKIIHQVCEDFDSNCISGVLGKFSFIISLIDKYLARTAPWKHDIYSQKETFSNILYISLAALRTSGFIFYPFFPKKFDILLNILGENTENKTNFFERAKNFWGLKSGYEFREIPKLFERIDLEKIK